MVNTVGPDSGTHLNMWSFAELHNTFYADMVNVGIKRILTVRFRSPLRTYPFSDMHNKLIMALQTGQGAPDLCDVEIGQFPNFLQGDVQLYPLNDAIKPYQNNLVPSRLDVYSKDGNYYGAPTPVGATVMYYNTKYWISMELIIPKSRHGMITRGRKKIKRGVRRKGEADQCGYWGR